MITVEEALAKGVQLPGQTPPAEFIITSMSDLKSEKNTFYFINLEKVFNESFKITNYSKNRIKQIVFKSILYENFETGVIRHEQKYYNKRRKSVFIDLRNPHYEAFCKATKQEALRIMASEILRGSEKFLKNEPDFDFPKFYDDVKALFVEKGLILNED